MKNPGRTSGRDPSVGNALRGVPRITGGSRDDRRARNGTEAVPYSAALVAQMSIDQGNNGTIDE
jgi:hypothetical protein